MKRHREYLAYLVEQRDNALIKGFMPLAAQYEEVIIAMEKLTGMLEAMEEVMSEMYRRKK